MPSHDAGRSWGPEWSAGFRRGPVSELRRWLDAALSWCDEADAIALRHVRRDLRITTKPDLTLVTEADTEIETRLRERIAESFPGHGVVGEELGTEAGSGSCRWFVDPIDGTHNFVRGIPIFATLLAVERDGELQVGVVSAPLLRSRWFAWRGGGAWRVETGPPNAGTPAAGTASTSAGRPQRLATSGIDAIADAQVLYAAPSALRADRRLRGFDGLLEEVWRDRGFGDFWGYMLVAEGAAEAMLELGVASWDLAAPSVIVEEAGGRLTDIGGERRIDAGSSLATNGPLHEAVRLRLATT